MKLLICLECGDIFNLTRKEKVCGCGKTSGRYVDELNAVISGECQPMGISNPSYQLAYKLQKIEDRSQEKCGKEICCEGVPFEAFFIPSKATSIKRIVKEQSAI